MKPSFFSDIKDPNHKAETNSQSCGPNGNIKAVSQAYSKTVKSVS